MIIFITFIFPASIKLMYLCIIDHDGKGSITSMNADGVGGTGGSHSFPAGT